MRASRANVTGLQETPITRFYANARVHRIWAGSSEIMKEIVGRSLGL